MDPVIKQIAEYICTYTTPSEEAKKTAALCLSDALGCAFLALKFPACTRLLGPVVPGTAVPGGSRVPGTSFVLDPIRAAFNLGTMIRWLDYNDTWLAKEWTHPSDAIGAILPLADYLSQKNPIRMEEVLLRMIQVYEVIGGLALRNSCNQVGLDHVFLVKVAVAGVAARMLGAGAREVERALSQAFVDGGSLRTYRHGASTSSRKSWAAGDAAARGVQFALMTMQGEPGIPAVLEAKKWGLYDALFQGRPFTWERPLGCYVMENILFKVQYPAEFHAQTALEAAISLHPGLRLQEVRKILIETQEAGMRIIDKKGPLTNPADRDHCLQYIVAIGLLHGTLTALHYEDKAAADPRIEELRKKMEVVENRRFSKEYLDPEKRSIANAITLFFKDGTKSKRVEVAYPLGHRRRREEARAHLLAKLKANMPKEGLVTLFEDYATLSAMLVHLFCKALMS